MSRREHDAVREARDALLVIAVATPPLLVVAVLFGVASSQLDEFLRWVGGTLLMAVVLLVCLARRCSRPIASPATGGTCAPTRCDGSS